MAEDLTTRRKIALRRYQGLKLRAGFLERLSEACRYAISSNELVSLEETEHLKESFVGCLRRDSVQRWFWSGEQEELVASAIDSVKAGCSGDFVLFSSVDDVVGAVIVDGQAVLTHFLDVWRVTDHDLMMAKRDLQTGLCLERNIYGREKIEYELSIWGDLIPRNVLIGASRVSRR